MAIKQRVLDKLAIIETDLIAAAQAEGQEALADALKQLSETKNQCRQGLPKSRHADYNELCDGLMFALGQLAAGQAPDDKGEVLSLCGDLLKLLNHKIREEGDFKKEIVFLPYNAAMWDSLESVWRAADEDKERCVAYVVPIPYAERNPDGSAAEWRCERDQFPKEIPTLDWQESDLEAWHPDVIFIHNGYDRQNKVTSVDPRYYSDKLKQCTDKLVYIPYFVLGEPDNWTEEQEESISEYVLNVPAIINADLTIVQSEAMRQVYIHLLARHSNRGREFWEKKILGLGSPKFDKVAASRKEDFEIPESWKKILRGRKAILYNTSLVTMLKCGGDYLDKVRSVLETFKRQENVALWWRPHPLAEASLRSMEPGLLAEYEAIVARYRREGWGIYDDTANLHRAIAWTDGYYGDGSSLVELYRVTGKPIMTQNVNVVANESISAAMPLKFYGMAFHGGYMYFSVTNFNALFRVGSGMRGIEFLGHFCHTPLNQRDFHRKCILVEDTLYFIPLHGRGIHAYHVPTRQFSFVPLANAPIERELRFSNAHRFGNEIFLVPFTYEDDFYCYDLENKRVERLEKLTKIAKKTRGDKTGTWIDFQGSVVVGDTLYAVVYNTKHLLKINLRTYRLEKIVLPVKAKLQTINFMGGVFWFTMAEHAVLRWDEKTQEAGEIPIPSRQGAETFGHPYLRMFKAGSKYMVAPGRVNDCWLYDEENDAWENLRDSFPEVFRRTVEARIVLFGDYRVCADGRILFFPKAGDKLVAFSPRERTFTAQTIRPLDFLAQYRKIQGAAAAELMEAQSMIWEGQMPVEDFLAAICGGGFAGRKICAASEREKQRTTGEKIYCFVAVGEA